MRLVLLNETDASLVVDNVFVNPYTSMTVHEDSQGPPYTFAIRVSAVSFPLMEKKKHKKKEKR